MKRIEIIDDLSCSITALIHWHYYALHNNSIYQCCNVIGGELIKTSIRMINIDESVGLLVSTRVYHEAPLTGSSPPLQCPRCLSYAPKTSWWLKAGRSPSSVRSLATRRLQSSGRRRAVWWDLTSVITTNHYSVQIKVINEMRAITLLSASLPFRAFCSPTKRRSPSAVCPCPWRAVWPSLTPSAQTPVPTSARGSTSPAVLSRKRCWRSQVVSKGRERRECFAAIVVPLLSRCSGLPKWPWWQTGESLHYGSVFCVVAGLGY